MSAAATISLSKLSANRSNAAHSTGPRTEAGKAKSSRNSLRHGFYSKEVAVTDDERRAFRRLNDAVIHDIAPRDTLERLQAERIASLTFRIRRLQQAQEALLINEHLDLFDDLRTLADDRCPGNADELFPEPGSVDPVHALSSLAGSADIDALERLSRLEQRLDTQLQRAWKQLKALQDPKRKIAEQEGEETSNAQVNAPNEPTEDDESAGAEEKSEEAAGAETPLWLENPSPWSGEGIVRNEPTEALVLAAKRGREGSDTQSD